MTFWEPFFAFLTALAGLYFRWLFSQRAALKDKQIAQLQDHNTKLLTILNEKEKKK